MRPKLNGKSTIIGVDRMALTLLDKNIATFLGGHTRAVTHQFTKLSDEKQTKLSLTSPVNIILKN